MAVAPRSLAFALLAQAAAVWSASPAFACPECLTGRVARASVFGDDFALNLLAIGSPLLVLAVIVSLLHRIDHKPRAREASAVAENTPP
jgi:hypothetical protein